MTDMDERAIRADTWREAADNIGFVLADREGGDGAFVAYPQDHPLHSLSERDLLVVQDWLQDTADELSKPADS